MTTHLEIGAVVRAAKQAVKDERLGYHLEGNTTCRYKYDTPGYGCAIGVGLDEETAKRWKNADDMSLYQLVGIGKVTFSGAPEDVFHKLQELHDLACQTTSPSKEEAILDFELYLNNIPVRNESNELNTRTGN